MLEGLASLAIKLRNAQKFTLVPNLTFELE